MEWLQEDRGASRNPIDLLEELVRANDWTFERPTETELMVEVFVTESPMLMTPSNSTRLPAHIRRGRSIGGMKPPRSGWPSVPSRLRGTDSTCVQ